MSESALFFTDFSVFIPIFAGVLTGGQHVALNLIAFKWLRSKDMKIFNKWLLRISLFRFAFTLVLIVVSARYFNEEAWVFILSVCLSYSFFLVLEIRQLKRNLDHNSLPNV